MAVQAAQKRLHKLRQGVGSSKVAEGPSCIHIPSTCNLLPGDFFFPFEPILELRKEVELNERKLRSCPQCITHSTGRNAQAKPSELVARGEMVPSPRERAVSF